MSSLLKAVWTVVTKKIFAIFFTFIALHTTLFTAHAAPVLDSSFGSSGIVRIGVSAGAEDTSSASALQHDGKLLLAGLTMGRQSRIFVLRLLSNGVPDATFGQNGVALFDLPNVYRVQQIEQGADGSILINGSSASGFVLTRLTAAGMLDTRFGTQGLFSADVTPARFVQQPDGSLLIVSDATQVSNPAPGEQFVLRLTRLNPAGVRDSTYAPNGEKILSGLPSNFYMASGASVVAEPDGGFTVMARATISDGSYLLVRITAAGTLNFGFGEGGFVRGYAVDNHFDKPVAIVRTANGGLLLMGKEVTPPSYPFDPTSASTKIVLWRVTADGLSDASLGTDGRLEIGSGDSDGFRLAALNDGSIALVNVVYAGEATTAHVIQFINQ